MHIDRLEVKGFGKLKGSSIVLKKGLNIIYGSNEAGKSSLQWFIKGMFYGLKGTNRSRVGWLQPLKRFAPWDGGQYGGAMVYTLDDGSTHRVERDFERDTLKIYDSFYNDITDLYKRGREKQSPFAEIQLRLDEATFERTVLIKQLEVRLDDDSSSVLAGKLANAGSSGFDDISFSKAEKALTDALKNNVGTGRTTTQPLDRLEARLVQLEMLHEKLLAQQGLKNDQKQDLLEMHASGSRLQDEKKHLEHIGELIEVRKALDLNLKLETGLKEAVRQLKELESDVVDECAVVKGINQEKHDGGQGRHLVPLLYLSAAVLFTAFLIYFFVTGTSGGNLLYILICGCGTLGAGIASLLTYKKEQAEKSFTVPEVVFSAQEEAAERILQRKSICSSASLLCGRLLEDSSAVRQELKEVSLKLDKLSRRLEAGIEAASGVGSGTEGSFAAKKLDMVLYDLPIESLTEAWKSEMENVNHQILNAALKEKFYEGQLVDSQDDSDELQHVEEETVAVREKITYLKHRGQALKLAHEVLTEAGREVRRTFAPGLDSRLSSIISRLTAGRYSDLKGDDKLTLRVAVPENGDIRNIHALSGAAADQMYLALRLSMADILTAGGESLPLVMDEIFSQFDDSRTKLAIQYLNNAYENRQVLIFTCKQREVELAREICGNSLNLVEL